jgi:hypothetical protein
MNPRGRDPFDNAIVSDAWSSLRGDVPTVHHDIYEQCTTLVRESWAQQQPKSLLIHGSAGSGKTHLLSRLRAAVTAADEGPIFCYVRLSTAPNMIRRHLRRCLVNDLVRYDAGGLSQLDHVLVSCLDKQLHGQASLPRESLAARLDALRSGSRQWDEAREAFQDIAQRLQIDFNLARACGFWLRRRRRTDVVEWLTTGDLPDESRAAMGLTPRSEEDADESPEQIAGEVVSSLIRLITETRSLVLCFDQIEALQTSLGDKDGFYAFGRMVSDLFDMGLPMVFITCAQSMLLPAIKAHIPEPFFHRLAQDERVLAELSDSQARDLIRSRVNAWEECASADRSQSNPLWPLNEEMLRRFMSDGDRTPRRLFSLCRAALPRAGRKTVPPETRLLDEFETRREAALGAIPDAHGTFVHGLAQWITARGRHHAVTPEGRRDVDIVISPKDPLSAEKSLVIGVCNQKHNALTARLKRIREEPAVSGEERIVVREAFRPIPQTSVRAREHWDSIGRGDARASGSRVRRLLVSAEALAALEAVRAILSDARAGDLTHEGETVGPETVEAWIKNRLLDESLEQLVAELVHGAAESGGSEPANPGLRDNALEILQSRHVVALSELAAEVKCPESVLIDVVASNDPAFGVLGSPPSVVFERVAKTKEDDIDAD